MAPAKGTKRAAQAAVSASANSKRPKMNSMMHGVADAITQAEGMTESCRQMLLTAIPYCLSTSKELRHDAQSLVVQQIGETIESIESKLKVEVEAASAKLAEANVTKTDLEEKAEQARSLLGSRAEMTNQKDTTLSEAAKAIESAEAALADVQKAQQQGDASLVEARKEKEVLEAVLKENVGALKASDYEAEKAQEHAERVLPLAKRLGLDESLAVALPPVCKKAARERGAFDVMVLDQLESGLVAKASELAELISSGASASADRAAAVEAAETQLAAATRSREEAADAVAAAKAAQGEAATALSDAEAAIAAFMPDHTLVTASHTEKNDAFLNFQNYNLECFVTLRDKVLAPEEEIAGAGA